MADYFIEYQRSTYNRERLDLYANPNIAITLVFSFLHYCGLPYKAHGHISTPE